MVVIPCPKEEVASLHLPHLNGIGSPISSISKLILSKIPIFVKKSEITFLENKDHFTEKEWKSLYKLSENTFVEESESLKQGAAGAGLTDND